MIVPLAHGRPAVRLPSHYRLQAPSYSPVSACSGAFRRLQLSILPRRRQYAAYAVAENSPPPDPASLSPPRAARTYTRTRRWGRRLIIASAIVGTVYAVDIYFNASALTRCTRTFGTGVLVFLDYKINFRPHPPLAKDIDELHARNARRLFDLLSTNGGLYLKIGQAVAMQTAVLPRAFQDMFSHMFDDAPQNDWRDVERVIRQEFGGRSAQEVFNVTLDNEPRQQGKGVMERKARASASVAQVHWARLADGREVAVKIQKREIAKQIGWDLWAFKVVAWIYSRAFDIPFYGFVPFVTERLKLETDFENEARNSEKMAKLIAGEPRLRDRVHVPPVDHPLSTRRVMTAEWIEGVRLWDKDQITRPWPYARSRGSPGCHATPLDPPKGETWKTPGDQPPSPGRIKPERDMWRGTDGKGGLGVSLKEVMTSMVDLFSAQMFLWGYVHCDPHPGNMFVRRQPGGKSELVLIDHGLYIHMEPEFRQQYARFWRSLMTFDNDALREIAASWGIDNAEIFASATLMRPYTGGTNAVQRHMADLSAKDAQERSFAAHQRGREALRTLLTDEAKFPRELLFVGRNLRIVQGNNQYLGSPVNRVKILGQWASRALVDDPSLPLTTRLGHLGRHIVFQLVMFSSDVVFYFSKLRQKLGWGRGMEDDIENQMRVMAKDMGIELNHSVFEG